MIWMTVDMVSIVIGKGGSQIKQLQERTHTEIFISTIKYEKGALRSAQVKGNSPPNLVGKTRDIVDALKKMYGLIEERAPYALLNARTKEVVIKSQQR